jgi:ABC-type sugar transport system permease subunit
MTLGKKKNARDGLFVATALAPSLLIILVFSYFSIFYCFGVSFFRWNMLSARKFIGLRNYAQMFASPEFWNSVKVTLIYAGISVPLCVGLGLLVGLVLKNLTFGKSFFRVTFFLPVIVSMVVASIVWKWILDPDNGVLNYLIFQTGLFKRESAPHWLRWLRDPMGGSMAGLLIVGVWKRIGYNAVIFLAGLQNIPADYYEAATLEGASVWEKFRSITLPLLSPTTFFVTIMEICSAIKVSVSPLVMTKGGPVNSTEVLVLGIYKEAFENFRMGYASAMAVFVFVLIMAITVFQFQFGEKKVHYQ